MTTVDTTTAQTIGTLVEGHRQLESGLARLEGRIDKLEAKLDKLLWVSFGIIGSILAAIATGVTTAVLLN